MKTNILRWFITLFFFFTIINQINAQVGAIVDSFSYSMGTSFGFGIAYDGTGFWISGSSTGYIYKYSSAGFTLDSIADPAVSMADMTLGMVYDGSHLWTTCYTCDTLYQVDLTTRLVTGRFTGMAADERVSIGYDGNNKLFFANGSDGTGAFIFDKSNGSFTPWGETATARGLVYFNNNLYGTDKILFPGAQARIWTIDTVTGNVSNYQNWCVNDAFGGMGMAYDGQFIWQMKYGERKVYKIRVTFPVVSTIRYVSPSGGGTKDGSDWSNALDTAGFQPALNLATAGMEFWVAAGTYKPTYGTSQTVTFYVPDSVKVFGGFAGTETTLNQRDYVNNVTILDGQLGNPSDTDNVNRIVTFDHVSDQTRLDGFTIQHAYNNNPAGYPAARGGGIYIDGTTSGSSRPVIVNCIIQNNQSTSGAGCYSNAGNNGEVAEHFVNCIFRENTSYISHGGAYRSSKLNGGNLKSTFENCQFERNATSSSIYQLGGGAIYIGTMNEGAGVIDTRISQCKFIGNAAFTGGAIFVEDDSNTNDSVLIANAEFYNNTSGAGGNAIYESRSGVGTGYISISSSVFKGNSNDTTPGHVQGTVFSGVNGGTTNLVIDNCLISGNRATVGGGVSLNAAIGPLHATITNSTIASNAASGLGGGIDIQHYNPGYIVDLHIHNSIIWGNSSSLEQDTSLYAGTPVIQIDNSVIQGGYTGIHVLNSDPLFVNEIPFANAPDTSGDYQLQQTSAAINSGDNNFVISPADLLGNIRIYNSTVDMGCYESGSIPLGEAIISQHTNGVLVFPNPVTDQFRILTTADFKGRITLYDMTGKLISDREYIDSQTFDLSALDPGMYTLNLYSSSGSVRAEIHLLKAGKQ